MTSTQDSPSSVATLIFKPPGLLNDLTITFPDSNLAGCGKCKIAFKSRQACRIRARHTAPPWSPHYICITLDDSAVDRTIVGESSFPSSIRINLVDMPLEVKQVHSPSTQYKHFIHDSSSFGSETPCCVACKIANRSRFVCRVKEKHALLPWTTVFATVGRAENGPQAMLPVGMHVPVAPNSDNIRNVHPSLTFLVEISSQSTSLQWLSLQSEDEATLSSTHVSPWVPSPGSLTMKSPSKNDAGTLFKAGVQQMMKEKRLHLLKREKQQKVNNPFQYSPNGSLSAEQGLGLFNPSQIPYSSLLCRDSYGMNPLIQASVNATGTMNYPSYRSQMFNPLGLDPFNSQIINHKDMEMPNDASSLARPNVAIHHNDVNQFKAGYSMQQLHPLQNDLNQERIAYLLNQQRYNNFLQQQILHQLQMQQLPMQNLQTSFPLGPSMLTGPSYPVSLRDQLMLRQAQASSFRSPHLLMKPMDYKQSLAQKQNHDEPNLSSANKRNHSMSSNDDSQGKRKMKRYKNEEHDGGI
jgi:hypothetical protein